MFYTNAVVVKMLPFDNKPEFNVLINLPEGTPLAVTANVAHRLSESLRTVPEVTALQNYAGTVSPYNFNGMVRHYYLRDKPWEADIQVMLLDKHERERSSHDYRECGARTVDADRATARSTYRRGGNAARPAGAADHGSRGLRSRCRNPAPGRRGPHRPVRGGAEHCRCRQLYGGTP